MNFETCLSCLKVKSVYALMKRTLNPHISYKIEDDKIYYTTDEKNWFLFVGSFTADDVMADDWKIYNLFK